MAEDGLPVLEYGRYRIWETPDGGWLLARAAFTCDRCQSCGCGEQQDHISVPGMMVRMAEAMQRDSGGHNPLAMMRRLMKRGRDTGTEPGGGEETAEGSGDPGDDLDGVPAAGLPDQAVAVRADHRSEALPGTV